MSTNLRERELEAIATLKRNGWTRANIEAFFDQRGNGTREEIVEELEREAKGFYDNGKTIFHPVQTSTWLDRPRAEVRVSNTTAHWERSNQEGNVYGDFRIDVDGSLSVTIVEDGRKSSKQVMVHFNRLQKQQLIAWLQESSK